MGRPIHRFPLALLAQRRIKWIKGSIRNMFGNKISSKQARHTAASKCNIVSDHFHDISTFLRFYAINPSSPFFLHFFSVSRSSMYVFFFRISQAFAPAQGYRGRYNPCIATSGIKYTMFAPRFPERFLIQREAEGMKEIIRGKMTEHENGALFASLPNEESSHWQ